MYAIVQIGSEQYKVSEGDVIACNRLETEKGKTVTLDQVLLVDDGKSVKVGQPHVKGVKVTAKVVDHELGNKLIAFKYRRRQDSATKKGHRQKLTALNITKIA